MVEMLIVLAVILLLAAIAVTNFLRARMQANEAAAVANMRTVNTAEAIYYNTYPTAGYADSLAKLGGSGSTCENPSPAASCIIMDEVLTGGLKGGYRFELLGDGQVPAQAYTLTALPEFSGTSGGCAFTSSQSGEIAAAPSGGGGRFSLATNNCDQPGSVSSDR